MSFFSNNSNNSIDSNSALATSNFSSLFLKHLTSHYNSNYDDIIIVCIGTDRSTGDCLGPLIGYKLSSILKKYPKTHVLGTLSKPVHAKNLKDNIDLIQNSYHNPFTIAIDACLGKLERVGYISIAEGPLKPGAGVDKTLPEIGDINITGVVNIGGFMEYVVLQNTRLNTVMNMANIISNSIIYGIWKLFKSSLNATHLDNSHNNTIINSSMNS